MCVCHMYYYYYYYYHYIYRIFASSCPPVHCPVLETISSTVMQPLGVIDIYLYYCLFKVQLTSTSSLKAVLKRVYGRCVDIFS